MGDGVAGAAMVPVVAPVEEVPKQGIDHVVNHSQSTEVTAALDHRLNHRLVKQIFVVQVSTYKMKVVYS